MLMEMWQCRYQPCEREYQVAGYRVGGKGNRKSVLNQRSAQLFKRDGYSAPRVDHCTIQAWLAGRKLKERLKDKEESHHGKASENATIERLAPRTNQTIWYPPRARAKSPVRKISTKACGGPASDRERGSRRTGIQGVDRDHHRGGIDQSGCPPFGESAVQRQRSGRGSTWTAA